MRLLRKAGVQFLPSVEVQYADANHLHVLEKGTETKLKRFDLHVLALGLRSKNELKSALKDFEGEYHIIGDAKEPRRGADAILEGARLGNIV